MPHAHLHIDGLVLRIHDVGDVGGQVGEHSRHRGSSLNSWQSATLDSFKINEIFDLSDNRHDNEDILNAYFRFFDDVLFAGKVTQRCKCRLSRRYSFNIPSNDPSVTETENHGIGPYVVPDVKLTKTFYHGN